MDVGVIQGLLHRDPALWVNHQHLGQQVSSLTGCRERDILHDMTELRQKAHPAMASSTANCVWIFTEGNWEGLEFPRGLTLDLVVLGLGGKGPIGEKLGKVDAGILRLVHHIVPHRLHQTVHELERGRAQHLDHLVPLVNV